jgi:hypothetical protein
MNALAQCERCEADVQMSDVRKEQVIGDKVFVIYEHKKCKWVSQVVYSTSEWRAIKDTPEAAPIDHELEEFCLDLAAIGTVADLEAYWYKDRRYRIG